MTEQSTGSGQEAPPSSDSPPSLDPRRHRRRQLPIWTVLAIIVGIGIVISFTFGFLGQPGKLNRLVPNLGLSNGRESVILVESGEDLLVMTIDRGNYEELRVLNVTSGMIEDVSHGVQQTRAPALSQSGELVAFFTVRNQRTELDISEIGGSSHNLISTIGLSALAQQKGLTELEICPWTNVWWSKDDRYLAFFSCSEACSLVTVKDRDSGDLFSIDSTETSDDQPRTLLWLSSTEIAVVQPQKEYDTVWIIDVVSLDKRQVYGP